ncbi:ribonuclease T2 family protein [Colletotrichum orchidophilum]|uniref:ribonuclease T2 n=1 Tax=Colletotrichum orchidophilum TaxID=1209926 RepID=A0A1G4AMG7_9PEZI|nr:ribonuclease T2 family protein [Colletotrichum orchidophilum]OHE90369.1 ribonuclease T2 family protein [Colletotrichum orchidophilum]
MSRTVGLLVVAGLLRTAAAGLYPGLTTANHTCALVEPILSCSCGANPDKVDTCCVETYGGLVLATQFWNTHTGLESEGQKLPANAWGIHGLWPDFCNGSYTQYCDLSRQYDPAPSPNTTNAKPDGTPVPAWTGAALDEFVKPFERFDLLEYMKKFWIAQYTPNWVLWAHEFSKHATCFSTFDVECYGPKYQEHEEVVDFLETAVHYYQETPTWKWLAAKDIKPSNATAYSLSDLQAALKKGHGAVPYLGCSGPRYNATEAGKGSLDNGYTQLTEAWYYFHVHGKPQRGDAVPVAADINGGRVTNCATTAGAIWYYERSEGSVQ